MDGGGYGQNIASGDTDLDGSIGMWYNETVNFDYYGDQNPGGTFDGYGHFTQMIWAYSTSLGCATLDCGSSASASGNYTVCNYFQGGKCPVANGSACADKA